MIPHAKAVMRTLGERCAADARFIGAVFPEKEQRAQAEKILSRLVDADFEDPIDGGLRSGKLQTEAVGSPNSFTNLQSAQSIRSIQSA